MYDLDDDDDDDDDWNGIVIVVVVGDGDGVGNDEWNGKYNLLLICFPNILHFFFVFFLLLFNVSQFNSSFFSWSSCFESEQLSSTS